MKITVASLTLRFYKCNGWTKTKVRKLLVNPKIAITYRKNTSKILGDISYYAVYENSGYKVFKESEINKHEYINIYKFGKIDWYIK